MKSKYIVGIDEAGRGPLAGPVAVGVAVAPGNFDWESQLPGLTDSKKLSELQRATLHTLAKELKKAGEIDFAVAMVGASVIDRIGIARSIAKAIERAIRRLKLNPEDCFVKLDGSLKAPEAFAQETIIKGDLTEPPISLASVVAKETRDAYMRRLAKQYAHYDFHIHKGYGTQSHREAIKKYGMSVVHRQTYCRNIFSL